MTRTKLDNPHHEVAYRGEKVTEALARSDKRTGKQIAKLVHVDAMSYTNINLYHWQFAIDGNLGTMHQRLRDITCAAGEDHLWRHLCSEPI